MLTLQNTESIVTAILLFLAYAIAATLIGVGQAYIADACGDSTAKRFGFTSLNPFVHIDLVGALLLLWLGFGWSQPCPINLSSLAHKRGGGLRVITVLFAPLYLSIILSGLVVIGLLKLFGITMLPHVLTIFVTQNAPLSLLINLYPHASSSTIVVGALGIAFIFYTSLLATLDTIREAVRLLVYHQPVLYAQQNRDLVIMLISLIIMLLFAHKVWGIIMSMISFLALTLGHAIGVFT